MPAHVVVPLPWTQPYWFNEASVWIHVELERRGIHIIGSIEQQHLSPWSTVLRVPTDAGNIFFKATAPVNVYEVALTETLALWRPGYIVPVLASDRERGWMLMPDGGTRLREIIRADHDIRHWYQVLQVYVELQIEMSPRVDDLLALGVPDRRLATLLLQYEQLLTDHELLRIDLSQGLTTEQHRRLIQLVPCVAERCEQLAQYRIPETLHHGDFGDGNVFMQDGRCRFFDWGDACIGHPFFSLRTTLVSLEFSLGLEEDSPALASVVEFFLKLWTHYGSIEHLHVAYKLSQQLAAVNGALAWHRVLEHVAPAIREKYNHVVPSLLQEFLILYDNSESP
jgi:hypothetical protein